MVARIFLILFPVFAVIAVGYLYARYRRPDMGVANQLNMDIFVPALIFHALAQKTPDLAGYWELALGASGIVLLSGLAAWPVARMAGLHWRTFLPPMMFTNAGNLGIPVSVLAFGDAALPAAVIVFIIENVLHFTAGTYMMDHRAGLQRLMRMPIIVAAIAGALFAAFGWRLPDVLAMPVDMLGQIAIPLMLFALGVRLISVDFSDWRIGMLGAVACPLSGLAVAALIWPLLNLQGVVAQVYWVFAVLPPAVLNYMVAERYAQEPQRVASVVLLGNLFSMVSIPLMLAFLFTG